MRLSAYFIMNKKQILEKYYFDVKNPAAFGSEIKLYKVLKERYPGKFTRAYIRKWLEGVDSYSVLKQVRRKFRTPNVRVTFIDEQFDGDLSEIPKAIVKDNDGFRYLLFIIDVFSRFLWVVPLKNKSSKSVLDAVKEVFSQRKPKKFRTDRGSEFLSKDFK